MKKDELNNLLRDYVRNNLSPKTNEQELLSSIYSLVQSVLGQNCIQIGSYPRFTSITPVHDLDILYVSGKFDPNNINPKLILDNLSKKIEQELENTTSYDANVSVQTHSITIAFTNNDEEIISVDIVPAFVSGNKNEFGDDIYWVPELIEVNHIKRREYYDKAEKIQKSENDWWIKSDPRGYISVIENLNKLNPDFRKTIKFVKKWKYNYQEEYENFGLKSFHLEQVITKFFKNDTTIEIYDAVFNFFSNLPEIINKSSMPDRADDNRYIDEYIKALTKDQKVRIIQARDKFLILLENYVPTQSISDLLKVDLYDRTSSQEEFIENLGFKMINTDYKLTIDANVIQDGFRPFLLRGFFSILRKKRHLSFFIDKNKSNIPLNSVIFWKVKNTGEEAARVGQLRGEITKDSGKWLKEENTAYMGSHFVECYVILDSNCIAKDKIDVPIGIL